MCVKALKTLARTNGRFKLTTTNTVCVGSTGKSGIKNSTHPKSPLKNHGSS
jgi:hypothetical protein